MKKFAARHRVVAFVVGVALACASGAFAWGLIAYLGGSGTATTTVGSPPITSTQNALTFTPDPALNSDPSGGTMPVAFDPLNPGKEGLDIANASGAPKTITGLTGTVTTSDEANCPGSDFAIDATDITGYVVPAAGVNGHWNVLKAINPATLPNACGGVTLTLHLTATTD